MEIFYSENGIEKSLEVPVLEAAEHEEELMKSNFVKLSWRTEKHMKLPAGSYVIPFPDEKNHYDANDPRYPIKYRLLEPYVPDHEDDLEYKYDAQFQHPIMWLSKLPMMLVTGDISSWDSATKKISWGYTGTPQTIANFVVNVINWLATQYPFFGETIGSGWVALVDSDLIPTVTVNFESVSVMSAASLIAQACDCEFHFDFARKEFRLGSIKVGEQTELISGVNVGLAKVTESKEEFYNAFVIKGSTKNLAQRSQEGENYQILDRLTLDPMKYPDSMMYTDENGDIITRTEFLALGRPILMGELVFDDVYPKLDLYVYKVRERECWKLDENKRKVEDPNGRLDPSDGKRYKSYSKWYIRLAYPIYEIDSEGKRVVTEWKDYLYDKNEQIAGTTLQMSFLANDEEGALTPLMLGQGFFDLVYFENTTTEKEDDDIDPNGFTAQTGDYRIVFHEEGDYIIPTTSSGGIYPRGADTPQLTNNKATLINLNLGEAHKEQAYLDLEMVAKRKVKLMRSDLNNYEMNSDSVWFAKNNPYLYVGLNTLYNDNQGYTLDTHIIKIVTKVDYPFVQTITVGNKKIKGAIATMKEQIQTIIGGSFGGGSNSGSSISEQQLRTLIANLGIEFFLSKQNDDVASGEIGFLKGLWVKTKGLFGIDADGNLSANGGGFRGRVTVNDVRSDNYTGSGIADTGWAIVNDNGSGSSQAVFDYLTIRKKMIVNSLEIKETHVTAGDIAQTCASADIARTDYYEVDDQGNYTLLGYAKKKMPWYLRGMAVALGKRVVGSKWFSMFGHYKEIRVTLTAADLSRCNRIRCYFLAKDGEKEIENWFRVNDLIRCQTWNIVKASRQTYTPDLNDHDGNIFWWRKCVNVSWNTGTPQYFDPNGNKTANESDAYVNEGGVARLATNGTYSETMKEIVDGREVDHSPVHLDGNTYHWFDVAYDYEAEQNAFGEGKDTGWCAKDSDIPALGDKVVQFGNSTDPDRMNITLSEVNGSGNIDAPDIKMYRGVYTFNLERSWWGGVPCKIKISPATGCDFYAPHFRFITETGSARVPFDRQEKYWTSIAFERDEYNDSDGYEYPDYSDDIKDGEGNFVSRFGGSAENPIAKNYVRKCYYYDRVTHNGSLWLCSIANETWYWRATADFGSYHRGDKVTDYATLTDAQKDLCEHVRSYTNQEPSIGAGDWTRQVDKGDPGSFLSRAFCRTSTDIRSYHPQGGTIESPIPTSTTKTEIVEGESKEVVVSGITWTDGAPDGKEILWSTTAWFYSDGTHSSWTAPAQETDTQTQDIEFSPSYYQPADPYGDDASQKDSDTYKTQRHSQGWYDPNDPNDTLPSGTSWSDMIWRAERQIKNGAYSGAWSVSRVKGESSNRLDLTNQADLVSLDADGKVRFDRTVTTIARIFEGGTIATANVEKGSTLTAANMKYGSTSTCTVSDIVNGQVTITWNFKKGDTITATPRLIVMKLRNVEYSATFSLGTTDSEYIYQLNPSPSEISFSRTSTNTLTPSYVDLYCGYTKSNGSGTTTISNPTESKIDDNNYLYYRIKDSSGSWGSWTAYSGYIRVYSSTTNIDYELAISTASSWRNVSDSNAYEREVIPVVKDGKNGDNSVRVDLDNNNDTMLYSSSKGLISGQISSQAHLYDGAQEITSNITWKISASSGVTLKNNGNAVSSTNSKYYTGENDAWITTGGKVYVNGMSAMSGSVTVQATYTDTKGNTHTKYDVLTLKKIIDGDKYDLVIEPNAIPYNISETWSNKTISIKANRLSADGTKTENITLNSGGIYLAAYYKTTSSGSGSWNQITGSFSVTEAIVSNNDNILIELRKEKTSGGYSRTNPSTYTIEDYETIPVNKSKNGKNSVRLTLDNEHEDFLYSKSGLISPLGGATSQIRLYDGNTTKTYGTDFTASIDTSKSTGISTSPSSDNYAYITSAGVLTVKGISTDTALVVVKSSYKDSTYYAEFTANKTEQDKFDIVVNPNAIAFNNSEAWTDKDIKISANCTSLNGSFTEKYELQNSASNGLRLYYAYVDSSGAIGTLSQVTSSLSNVTFVSNVFTFTFKESAKANSGIYFELRYYTSSSAYRMCDYETVEIAKTENGEKGASVTSVDKYFKAVSTNSTPSYDSTWTKNATPNDWSETNKYLFCREYTNYSDSTGSWGSVYLHSVWGENGKNGKDGKYKLQAYKALDTQPSAPTGASVTETYLNDLGWYLTPTQAQNNGGATLSMSYTFTSSSWTRSGNTFTSPATTAHSQYYQARIGFTTSVDNVVINIKITASSEAKYDWGYVGELDTDHSSNMSTYGIRVSGDNVSQSYSLSVPSKGTHYFDIAYKKDGSTSSFNDNIIVQILSAKTVVEQIWESQTWVEKNTSGTEEAQGWSDPVRWNGTAGKQGHAGRWYEYYGDVTNSTVTLTNTDDHGWFVKKGSYFYMLISSSASTSTCPTIISSTDDWEYMGGDRQYYIAKAFFGDYAQFGSFIINGDWMLSTNGTINGTAYNDGATYGGAAAYTRFDPSYPNTSVSGSHTAPNGAAFTGYNFVPNFAVDGLTGKTYQNDAVIRGKVYATDGEFTGKVTAESGTIGGFNINSDKLTNTNYNASVSIQDAYGNQISRIGKEAKDAMTNLSCSLEAQSKGSGTYNTALYLNADGATYNYAFHGNGNGVLNGLIFGFKTKVYNISSLSTVQMELTDGATFVFHGSKSSGWANFKVPTLNNVKQSLGLPTNSTVPFAIEVNFINHSSYDYVSLQFYNSSRTNLPKWYSYNFDETAEDMQLARGDFARFLLTYDGSEYRANRLIHHDDGWG